MPSTMIFHFLLEVILGPLESENLAKLKDEPVLQNLLAQALKWE